MSCIAVVISFFLALVVCRITGEANITPTGAMGKVTQLIFGGIAPGHVTANLMAANITSGASSSSADLLVDLKVGYLLGANPRKQFIAQFSGIFLGTLVSVLAFRSMVPGCERSPGFQCSGSQNMGGHSGSTGHGGSAICTASRCFPSLQAVFSDSFWCLFPAIFPGQENGPPPSASAWPGPSSGTTPSFSLQELCSAGLRTIFSRPNHGNIKSPPPPASLQAQPSRNGHSDVQHLPGSPLNEKAIFKKIHLYKRSCTAHLLEPEHKSGQYNKNIDKRIANPRSIFTSKRE